MIKFDYSSSYRKARFICDDVVVFNYVRNKFSIEDTEAEFKNKKLKAKGITRRVPSRKYLIGESGLFALGMWKELVNFLISEQFTEITYTTEFNEKVKLPDTPISVSNSLNFDLRPYQEEVVSTCLTRGSGTIVVGTGGGKSLIQASLLENWINTINSDVTSLVIVPGVSLVSQLLKDFDEYGVPFTFSGWTGDMELQDTQVIIVNTELFHNKFTDNKWIRDIDLVLVDECHKVKTTNVLTKLLEKIKTPNKFGFTGTLPKEQENIWKIVGTFGEVIYEKKSKELRDEKYLSDVRVNILKINHNRKQFNYYNDEVEFISNDLARNRFIAKLALKLNNNVLIMVNRLEHGDNLLDVFEELEPNKRVVFIKGEVEVDKRQAFIQYLEENSDGVFVAMSSIFSTGINVKNLPYIIFTDGGKAFIRTIQSVGRGLRLHENKKRLEIFDLCDNMKYSERHIEHRKQFYDDEKIDWNEREIKL